MQSQGLTCLAAARCSTRGDRRRSRVTPATPVRGSLYLRAAVRRCCLFARPLYHVDITRVYGIKPNNQAIEPDSVPTRKHQLRPSPLSPAAKHPGAQPERVSSIHSKPRCLDRLPSASDEARQGTRRYAGFEKLSIAALQTAFPTSAWHKRTACSYMQPSLVEHQLPDTDNVG